MSVTETPTGILTFLIADIRGYTSFTQAHGDEGAARLADKFAEIAREGVEAYGGEVTELRGDEALAVFSSPRAAVRAAVELQTVFVDETIIDPAFPLTVGIGIDAGEAVPVQGGYRGGALNLAARLCSRAQAGEVLVSQGIAHLTRAVEGIVLEQAGEAEVKGLSDPVRVFRARVDRAPLESLGGPRELPAALAAVTPIIGREHELRRLRWAWRLARRGAPSIVVVQGPPGIGKTRLVAELAVTVAAGGASCRYVSLAVQGVDLECAVAESKNAGLLVLDDLDVATREDMNALGTLLPAAPDRAALVVLVLEDENASTEHLTVARRLAGADERVIRPRPLTTDEMLRVAALYVGAAADVVPHELLTATGGVPRRVHEQIAAWANDQAARRLGALATAAASGRSDLRSVESDLAGTVIDLQLVREQATLFGLGPGRRGPEPQESPYRGLSSFDAGDAELFFGRERLVASLISRLAGASMLGVVGASGSGKSSAVRAGLVPALGSGVLPGSEDWLVTVLRPGEHPIRSLDRALWGVLPKRVTDQLADGEAAIETVRAALEAGDRLVLVVDQFEEAFTLCRDEDERGRFLATLASAGGIAGDTRIAVVVAIRADYYGRCAADPSLAAQLAANHVLVGPMTAEEYRRAIVQPALHVGAVVEPELVDELVTEVLGEAGALPLLSTTLMELWEHRDGRTLRRATALATGGVHGAVARLADDVYASFDEDQQLVARGVLLRLTGPGQGDAVVRRRVPLSEFDADSDEQVRHVLDVLAERRLVTVSDGTVEVAHEALLREWPRLQSWLEEDREGRRLRAHLAVAAQEWASSAHDPGELYRGARLSAALDWTTSHTAELNEVEREFIVASRTTSQAELVRQKMQNRRLRGLLAGVVGVLVLALVAGGVALVQRRSAETKAREALARELGAEAVSARRVDEAMLLARQAVLLDNSPQTAGTLLATLLRSPAVRDTFTMPLQSRPMHITLSPDGRTLAVVDNNSTLRFFDTQTHQPKGPVLAEHAGDTVYSGNHILTFHLPPDTPATIQVYDATSYKLLQTLPLTKAFATELTGRVNPMLASKDGRTAYLAWSLVNDDGSDGAAFLDAWDMTTGEHRLMPLHSRGIAGASVLPDGHLLVLTDTRALTVDAGSLRTVHSVPASLTDRIAAISPDGRTLAVQDFPANAAPASTFALADVASGTRTPVAGGHSAPIQDLQFSPDGRVVVSSGDDGQVIVWDPQSGEQLETLSGQNGRVLGLAFSADGKTLYSSGLDGAVFGWDLGTSRRFGRPFRAAGGSVPGAGFQRPALAISPDGTRFAARVDAGKVGIFSIRTLRQDQTLTMAKGADVWTLAWTGRNQLLAAGQTAGVQVWDVAQAPRVLRTLSGVPGQVQAVAVSRDGRIAAAVTSVPPPPNDFVDAPTGSLGIWDLASGRLVGSRRLGIDGWSVAFSPDGTQLAVSTDNGHVQLTSATGSLQRTLDLSRISSGAVTAVVYRPDGQLLTGTWSGLVQHWNPRTGRQLDHPVLVEPAPVSSLTLAPGASHFAVTGGSSGALKIWDTASLQEFGADFPGGTGTWGDAAYTPDGSAVVVVYDDGSAAVWPVTVGAWMQHACAVAGRNFSTEEWNRFVPGHSYRSTCPGLLR